MVTQAKPAIPGMTPGALVPQSDEVEPGFTPTQLPSAGPPIANVQAKPTVHGTEDDRAGLSNWAPELNMLYDTTTGKAVRLDYKDIAPALLQGKVGFRKGESIPMIRADGESWNIPAENVNAALMQGYRLEHPSEIAVREFRAENQGISGSAKAFLTNFADEALFGVPGIVYQHSGDVSDLERAKLQALKNDNPIENAVGGGFGFGASMFYGGELFQLATKGGRVAEGLVKGGQLAERAVAGAAAKTATELAIKEGEELAAKTLANRMVEAGVKEATAQRIAPGLLRSTAANMAKYGVEGAVISAPKAITEAIYDPKLGAEHLAVGIGTGALLGAFGPLGKGFTSLTRKVGEWAPEQLSSAGIVKNALNLNNIEQARTLLDEKVIDRGMSVNTIKSRLEELKLRSNEEMGNVINKLDDSFQKQAEAGLPAEGVNLTSAWKRLQELRASVDEPVMRSERKAVDNIMETLYKRSPIYDPSQLGREFSNFAMDKDVQLIIGFKEAKQLRDILEKTTNWDVAAKSNVNAVKRQAYGIIRGELDDAIGRMSESLGDPAIKAAFEKASTNSKMAEDISYLLHNKDLPKTGENIFGLSNLVMGGSSVFGAAQAIAAGNIMAGLIWPVLGYVGKKALQSTYAKTALAATLHRAGIERSGVLFAEQAIKYGAEQMDRIPGILEKLADRSLQKPTPAQLSLSAMSRFLGKTEEPKSVKERNEMFAEVSKKINELALNPEQTANRLGQLSAPLAATGAPKLSQAYIEQTIKTFNYLQSILPNANKSLTPFKKNYNQLSDKELSDFEHALRIVENPYNILGSLTSGTVTQREVDTLAAIYPSIYRDMVAKISEFAYSGKASTLPYQTRLKLSLLMGIKLDQSIQDVNVYQANFAKPEQKSPAGSNLNIITPKGNPYQTPIQKAMTK